MEPYIGEIRVFPWGIIPSGWASCNGAILPVGQNFPLFALIGSIYGGDGKTTFALPDLRGKAMLHFSSATDTVYTQGSKGGQETVALNAAQMPLHTHTVNTQNTSGTTAMNGFAPPEVIAVPVVPTNNVINAYIPDSGHLVGLNPSTITPAGSGYPHDNMPPFIGLNICIALTGLWPSKD